MSTTEHPPLDRLATGRQVAERYPISSRTLRKYVSEGKLTGWQLGGRRLYDLDELDALLVPVRRGAA